MVKNSFGIFYHPRRHWSWRLSAVILPQQPSSFLLQKVLLAAAVRCLCQLFAGSGPHQKVAVASFFVTCYEQEKSEPKAAWQRVRISIYLFPKENRCSVQARSICRCRHHARTSAMSIFFDSRRQAKTNFRTVLVSLRLFMPSIPDMPEFRKIILSFFPALPCGL